MKLKKYDMDIVIDLMASGRLQGQDAMKAIAQAWYIQRCRIVNEINRDAINEGCLPEELLTLPDSPEPFEIDLSFDNPLDLD